MASHSRMDVLNAILDIGVVPIFYNPDVDTAKQIVAACVAGGARVVEFTNRGDFAYHVFVELAQHFVKTNPDLILGVGSVADAGTAALYINNGADFMVSAMLVPEIARTCNRRKIPYAPGCGSLSEISQAEELGVEIVKIFPGDSIGGPGFVKAIMAPCPWTRIMATGGVAATEDNIREWFRAGVACVGMGSNLITKEAVKAGDFATITENVRRVIGWIQDVRAGK